MSLLGKIFAIVNLLGALGLTALAAMDYGKRVAWQHAVYKHDLLINGLPLSDKELDDKLQPAVDDLSDSLLREVFSNNAGQPVKTQVAEVERIKKLLDDSLNGKPREQQVVEYARLLTPFAIGNLQRENYQALENYLPRKTEDEKQAKDRLKKRLDTALEQARQLMAVGAPKLTFPNALAITLRNQPGESSRPFDEAYLRILSATPNKAADQAFQEAYLSTVDAQLATLKGRYDGLFQEALATEKENKIRPLNDHRQAIAHLLFNLAAVLPQAEGVAAAPAGPPDLFNAESYRRLVAVCGLETISREISEQALVLEGIRNELNQEIGLDRGTFGTHSAQIIDLVEQMADKDQLAKEARNRIAAQVAQQDALIAKRKNDLAIAAADLDKLQKQTDARFQELVQMRKSLYNIRIEVREATRDNQDRARQIAELERNAGK